MQKMSFVAINADAHDSQLALQQSLQYDELRSEYDEVAKLVAEEQLDSAWKRLSSILEGDLFADGPHCRVQPIIEDLQKSCLGLAFDLARLVDPMARQSLALEMVEWFPQEPAYWIYLAETLQGDLKELVVKRMALKRALSLSPWNRRAFDQLELIEAALGLPNRIRPLESPPFPPLEPRPVFTHQLRVEKCTNMSRLIEMICDLAERILDTSEAPPKRGRSMQDNTFYHAKLAAPIEILFDEPEVVTGNSRESPSKAAIADEDSTLQLSQPASIRNLQDFSQPSQRSQSRRLRGAREAATAVEDSQEQGAKKLTIKNIVEQLSKVFVDSAVGEDTRSSLEKALQIDQNHATASKDFIFDQGSVFDPPIEDLPSTLSLQELLLRTAERAVGGGGNALWSEPLINAMERLGDVITSNIASLHDRLSAPVLLWLAERLTLTKFKESSVEAMQFVLPRLQSRILTPTITPDHLVRYLWIEYQLTERVEYLSRLELVVQEMKGPLSSILILGAMNTKGCPVVNKFSLADTRKQSKRSKFLVEATTRLAELDESKRFAWLGDKVGSVEEWLAQIYDEGALINLALSVALSQNTAMASRLNDFALALALVRSICQPAGMTNQVLIALSKRPTLLIALFRDHQELSLKLLSQLEANGELACLFPCLLSALKTLEASPSIYSVVTATWRYFLTSAKERTYLADERFINAMADFLLSQPDGEVEELLILRYCIFRVIAGSPFLEISDDPGLVKCIGDDAVRFDRQLQVKEAICLFNATTRLLDLESIDGLKALSFLDTVVPVLLSDMESHCTIKRRSSGMALFMRRRLDQEANFEAIFHHFTPSEIPFVRTLDEILSLKAVIAKNLNVNKKKTIEALQSQRSDVLNRLLVGEDKNELSELLWQLGSIFDSELHQWLVRDATTILNESRAISTLFHAAFNCWKLSLMSGEDHIDLQRLGKFLSLVQSMFCHVLSFFMPPGQLDCPRIRNSVAAVLLKIAQRSGCRGERRVLQAKALAAQLCGKQTTETVALRISAIASYVKSDSYVNPEVLYTLIYAALYHLSSMVDGHHEGGHITERLFRSFISVLSTCTWFDAPDEACTLREQLLMIAEQLPKLDKKKTHHQHLYLLATRSPVEGLEDICRGWAKLLPIMGRTKSTQIVHLWQSEQDYPGDYLYFAELYVEEAAQMLVAAVKTEPQALQVAELMALMIGRVSVAHNIFIRRRRLLGKLYALLRSVVSSADAMSPSLADFREDSHIKTVLRDILEDAEELVLSQGVATSE